jgi:hypothetical protein
MAQDPLSHVASWLKKPTAVVATVDPIVAMKAEYDRLSVEINRISAPGYDGADAASEASLVDQLCALEAKVMEAVAISPAGLVAQIEVLRDCGDDYGVDGFNHLINGVRNIEASMAEPPLTDDSGLGEDGAATADVTDKLSIADDPAGLLGREWWAIQEAEEEEGYRPEIHRRLEEIETEIAKLRASTLGGFYGRHES